MIVLLCGWLMVVGWRKRNHRSIGRGCLVLLATGLALIGWGYRNSVVLGQWQFLTTRGGISLYDGVKPGATGASDLGAYKADPAVDGLSEVEWNQYFAQKSYEAIAKDPLRIVGLIPTKLLRTWSPVPNAGDLKSWTVRLIFGCWYVPLAVMVGVGIWSIRSNAMVWMGCLIPAICISVIHSVYVGSLRYRLAAIPTLAILAALGAVSFPAQVRRPSPDSVAEAS